MPDWLGWLIAAGVLAAAETASLAFVLAMASGGALVGSVVAAFGGPLVAQVFAAIAGMVLLTWLVRPVMIRHLHPGPVAITGAEGLVGEEAVVLQPVTRHDGRVRLRGGEWSARAADPSQDLPTGTIVTVLAIDGATAVVYRDPMLQ